jgi:2,3-dihydroxyphenylpropionate 1,2-dioxygenase
MTPTPDARKANSMSLAVCTVSHTPLMTRNEPAPGVRDRVEAAFAEARAFIGDFAPDVVVVLAPDHYNGFLYDMMPPFCIGTDARSVGDYGYAEGPLQVDRDLAHSLASAALAAGVDVAVSERMHVDHGFTQPLTLLFGGIAAVPTVPIFINSVAEPLGPVSRARLLGDALGRAVAGLDKRVLFLGSGGLSHDPPVPALAGATPEVAERLISGRNPTREQRAEREKRVTAAAREFAAGTLPLQPLNPEWDRALLSVLASGELEELDAWSNESFVEQAGHSSHEVRTSIAAYAALAAAGPYVVTQSFYEPIPEWIAGFAITTARPA